MPNNSGEKIKWKEIDYQIPDGWYILKLDGSGFKPLRMPNLEINSLEKYYECVSNAAIEVMKKYKYLKCCYVLDDEFHFLFHTSLVRENDRRVSKVVVLPTSYTTAYVNSLLSPNEIKSRLTIEFGKLCYDGRLVRIGKKKIIPYFDDIINHGKMFLGNNIVGQGKYFTNYSKEQIIEKAKEKDFKILHEHSKLFGTFALPTGDTYSVYDLEIQRHKDSVFEEIRKIYKK